MTGKRTEIIAKQQSKGKVWLLLLLLSVLGSICLFWTFLGLHSYFYPIDSNLLDKGYLPKTEEKISLVGKSGNYFVVLPTQQIQLIETIDPLRTLELQIAFSVNFTADKSEIEAKLPQIKDVFISYLRTLSLAELQETGHLFYIKEALLERINSLLFPTQIQDIFFQKFIIKEGL